MPFKIIGQETTIVETGTVALQTTTTNGALETTQLQSFPVAPFSGSITCIPVSGSIPCYTDFTTADKATLLSAITAGSSVFKLVGSDTQTVLYRFATESTTAYMSGSTGAPPFASAGLRLQQGNAEYFKLPTTTKGIVTSAANSDWITLVISS